MFSPAPVHLLLSDGLLCILHPERLLHVDERTIYILSFQLIDNQQSRIPCNQQHIRQMRGQRSLGSSLVLSSEHRPLILTWTRQLPDPTSHMFFSQGCIQWPAPLGPFTCHLIFTLTSCQQCPAQGSVPYVSHSGPSLIPRSPPGSHQLQPPVALIDDSSRHPPASQRCWEHEQPSPTTVALPWHLLSASLTQLLHLCFLGAPP